MSRRHSRTTWIAFALAVSACEPRAERPAKADILAARQAALSFDQRMKDIHYVSQAPGREVDLLEAALHYLSQTSLESRDQAVIDQYLLRMGERSAYVNFLLEGPPEGDSEMEDALAVE